MIHTGARGIVLRLRTKINVYTCIAHMASLGVLCGRLGRVLVDSKKRTQKDPWQKDPKGPMTLIERLFLAN
jgi:hypothetical protein